ncbi:transcription initiation factor TFIIIB [Bodo saltans virus]|uniref:Transcription initiation factor TFIIIB n=1 Tax=Bodo saltans virus TaxID=2024608 RepID=A0A2H4UU32_9VIRU|nr:transcription initiation factor TFIIIB [Bodo saltans virus]ATZ80408.1 transcription initiation factor TFIIIB [Bodo saltans virus]
MFQKYPELLKKQEQFSKLFNSDTNTNVDINNNNNDNDICNCEKCDLIEDYSRGYIACRNCGQILREIIDNNPEWKYFDDGDSGNIRCGAIINLLLPKSSLGTTIGGFGKTRVKTLQCWMSMPHNERTLNNDFKIIHEIVSKLKLSKCIEEDTKIMYKMATEAKYTEGEKIGKTMTTRRNNRLSVSAACMAKACKKKGSPYTLKEISEQYGISYSEINRGMKRLEKILSQKQNQANNNDIFQNQFIKRYCDNLHMLSIHTEEVIRITDNIEKINIASGHVPYSLAAATILLVAVKYNLKNITRKKIAAEFDISEVTISKTYKKLEEFKSTIFDDDKTNIMRKTIEEKEDEEIPEEIKKKMKLFGVMVE